MNLTSLGPYVVPYPIPVVILLVSAGLACFAAYRYFSGRPATKVSPQTTFGATAPAPKFKQAEPRNVTIGEVVPYKQHPRSGRSTSRKAAVAGFKTNRRGQMLISLADSFGNRFSVTERRIL